IDNNEITMDSVGWDNGTTFPDPNGASMALLDPTLDNSVGSNWQESTASYGEGDFGTPGMPNYSSDISLDLTVLNFDNVGINENSELSIIINNNGNATLHLDSLYTNSSLFTLSFADSIVETSIILDVNYTPVEFGPDTAMLFIKSNDPDENIVTVLLIGFGSTMSLSDTHLYFGVIVAGDTVTRQTTIYNVGMTDLEIEELNITGSELFTTDFSDGTIEVGGSISLEFQFTSSEQIDSVTAIATIVASNIPDQTITL
ncbi:uncharacterized protein METZ01_LOCUS447315, partial [marine metagenome]